MELQEKHSKPIKLIIVDDSEMYRKVMIEFLENELLCKVIDEARNGEAFLQLKTIQLADIVLLDLQMPSVNGFQVAKRMSIQYPNIKIIAVTMYTENVYLDQLVELGFKGCVFKTSFFDEIIPALEQVLGGGYYFNKSLEIIK